MGTAIIINGADFSKNKTTSIHFLNDIDVTGISIVANGSYLAKQFKLGILYHPSDTGKKGVNWSIISGNEYADINAEGVVTINQGVTNKYIVVKAQSIYNNKVVSTKQINVSYYSDNYNKLDDIIISTIQVDINIMQALASYVPEDTSLTGVTWSAEGDCITIDETGKITVLDDGFATIIATSTATNFVKRLEIYFAYEASFLKRHKLVKAYVDCNTSPYFITTEQPNNYGKFFTFEESIPITEDDYHIELNPGWLIRWSLVPHISPADYSPAQYGRRFKDSHNYTNTTNMYLSWAKDYISDPRLTDWTLNISKVDGSLITLEEVLENVNIVKI